MSASSFDVRVYPINEPKGATLAFASVAIGDLAAIRSVRVVDGANGMFVAMPQSQDNSGLYRDIAFPLSGDLRKEIAAAVLAEYGAQASLAPGERGYGNAERGAGGARGAEGVKLEVRVYPVAEPKGGTLAFASAALDDAVAIRGIRVVDGARGQFVSMPQSKDKDGVFHDVAFPLSGGLRKAVSNAVLAEYRHQAAEKRQSLGARIAGGREQAARREAGAPARAPAAKAPPGLGD